MADPYDSDSAVEQILSEAMDHHILEQISSINLSSLPSDSLLPSDLETRFRKLKSLPQPNPKSLSINTQNQATPTTPKAFLTMPTPISSSPEFDFNPKPTTTRQVSSFSSSSSSEDEASSSSSPPHPRLCFWCSPNSKRVSKKKKKESRKRVGDDDSVSIDSFISDFGKVSLKDQKRKLKRALTQQEKITREAEECVELAKQLSARISDCNFK